MTDKATGAPVAGAYRERPTATTACRPTPAAATSSRTSALGYENAPITTSIEAGAEGYWKGYGTGGVACDAITRADVQIAKKKQGRFTGTVIDRETRKPLAGAKIRDGYGYQFATTDTAGAFGADLELSQDNADRSYGLGAEANGYWTQYKNLTASATTPAQRDYELLKVCYGRLDSGVVTYADDGAAAAAARVEIPRLGVYLQAGDDGRFTVDKEAPLGTENTATSYEMRVQPGPDAPEGTQSGLAYWKLDKCGDVTTIEVKLPRIKPRRGAIEGTVIDKETKAPMAHAPVKACNYATMCSYTETDAEGHYRFEQLDMKSYAWRTVTAEPDGYEPASRNANLTDGETTEDVDLEPLKRHFAKLSVSVVDEVTGAPVPSAGLGNYNSTDRNGRFERDKITLGTNNAPRDEYITASATGYWPQQKVVRYEADKTTEVEYRLQPECDPAQVSGSVVNAQTGEPIESARISDGSWNDTFTNAEGKFTITGLKPGTGNNPRKVTLTASASGFFSQSKAITIFCGARIKVDFGSRTTKTGTFVGTVTDGTTNQPLAGAFVGTAFGGTATTDAEGRYRIPDAPLNDGDAPRAWAINVAPAGFKPKTLTATAVAGAETQADFVFDDDNTAPAATPQEVSLLEDSYGEDIELAGTDADGDPLTYHVMKFPQHGSLSRVNGSTWRYRPDGDYFGEDALEFIVNDGAASSERATVDIDVENVNDAPRAVDDTLEGTPDVVNHIPFSALLANDTDADGDELTVSKVETGVPGASVRIENGEVRFSPPPGMTTTTPYSFFVYWVRDPAGEERYAFVSMTLTDSPKAPVCADSSLEVLKDTATDGTVQCDDANGDALTATLVAGPDHGTVDLRADGTYTYTPPAGFTGTTSFTYRVSDGALESEVARVDVDVVETQRAPVCADTAVSTDEDTPVELTLSCTDPDGDAVTIDVQDGSMPGALAELGDGRYRYTPPADWSGTLDVPFVGSDGERSSAPATLTVAVAPVNDAPDCTDLTLSVAEAGGAVAPSCTDVEGDALTYEIAAGTGSVKDGKLHYVPAAGTSKTDEFTYRAKDATTASAPARVAVSITRPAPSPSPDPTTSPSPDPTASPAPATTVAPSPTPQGEVLEENQSGGEALLECADRPIVLEDVVPRGRRAVFSGFVDPKQAGRRVTIHLSTTGKVVARPTVDAKGRFAATAPLPRVKRSDRDTVRYYARIDGERSAALKVWRRLQVEKVAVDASAVVISGRVTGALAPKRADRAIQVWRQTSCEDGELAAKVTPRADGRFRVSIPRVAGARGAVFRLRGRVRNAHGKLGATFSLPRAVDF